MSPAACQVVPAVSWWRSSRTTSDTPSLARWYATDVPMTPPPMTTTLARLGRSIGRLSPPVRRRARVVVLAVTSPACWHGRSRAAPGRPATRAARRTGCPGRRGRHDEPGTGPVDATIRAAGPRAGLCAVHAGLVPVITPIGAWLLALVLTL